MRNLNLSWVRHAVVVAPHSDDETISAFHLIRTLRRRGKRVDVIVVTDGSASHRNSATYPKQRLIAERQRETCKAMQFAGVPRARIEFLGLPDGGLDTLTAAQRQGAVLDLARRPKPNLLVVPTDEDDHPDHRNVARICEEAWPPSVRRLRYMVWPAFEMPTSAARMLYVTGNVAAKKMGLCRYHTQLGLIRDDPHGFALTDAMIRRMCTSRERFEWG